MRAGRALFTITGGELNAKLLQVDLDARGNVLGTPKVLGARDGASRFRVLEDGSVLYLLRRPTTRLWLLERKADGSWTTRGLGDPTNRLTAPRLSPDLTRVALVRALPASGSVLEILSLVDGSSRRFDLGSAVDWLAWSPQGNRIAYRRTTSEGPRLGWVLDLDTGESTPAFGPSIGYVYWSPAPQLRFQPADSVHQNYLVRDETTGALTPLLDAPPRGTVFHSALSPDGRWLAVAGNRNEIARVAVWLIDLHDGTERLLYGDTAVPVGWSRDGTSVYATIGTGTGAPPTPARVVEIAIGDGTVRTLAELPSGDVPLWSDVDVSPDGDRIVASVADPGADLWVSRPRAEEP